MNRKTILLLATAITVLVGWLLTRQVYAAGITVVVNGNGDLSDFNPGDGSCDALPALAGDQCGLRAAIEELNALGPDTTPHRIEFNISGTGPFTITPNSELPAISVPVVIDGETQPGATCPTNNAPANLQIVLDGSSGGTNIDGLTLSTGSDGSVIRGLVIGSFDNSGIIIQSDENKVGCNHIGLAADGVSIIGNGSSGVYLLGNGNSIGEPDSPAHRNVISGNFRGVTITGEDNLVSNNFIGSSSDGMTTVANASGILGNVSGIYVSGNNNEIGGIEPAARNVLSGNNGSGISVNNGTENTILGNYVGVARDGNSPLPNNYGIQINGAAIGNVIGGLVDGESNVVAYNSVNGVQLAENIGGIPAQNQIRGNAIYANGSLGIDLGNDGVDTNDPGDSDSGENERQNYPVMVSVLGSTIVDISLDSKPNTVYQIDTYLNDSCDPSGFGEGQEYYQTFPQQTDSQGQLQFQFSLGGVTGRYFTATATDPDGNTSEFSNCALLDDAPTPTPTNTATPTNTVTATSTATSGPSPTPTNTVTPTATATASATSTATSSPTAGPSPTLSATTTVSPTPTLPPAVTPTGTPDATQGDSFFIYLPLVRN
jgi:hypothetical protein